MLNVALFGFGRIGQMHAKNIHNKKDLKLLYVFEKVEILSRKAKRLYDCKIENNYKKNAKYLNKLIQVIGTRSEKRIIKTFFEQFPEIENIFSSQSNVKEKKDYTSFFENYQNYLLVLLVIFLITFIVTIVSV